MRTKEDKHEEGASLGFIMMQRKAIEPIKIEFLPFKDGVIQYKLKLIV